MNRRTLAILLAIILIVGGITYYQWSGKSVSPKEIHVTVKAVKNEWRWDVENIQANVGDTIHFTFVNEDDYLHGIGIDGYGISLEIPPNGTATRTMEVNKKGKFNFYCTIPCGNGDVEGQIRGHFSMTGNLEVI